MFQSSGEGWTVALQYSVWWSGKQEERERERQGYGTALYKAKSCKQTDDCTNSVNYEANEKLKGSSNEKFDQMLFRLSFQVIKWSGKKKCSLRYILACDLLHSERKNAIKLGVSKSQFSFWQAAVYKYAKIWFH